MCVSIGSAERSGSVDDIHSVPGGEWPSPVFADISRRCNRKEHGTRGEAGSGGVAIVGSTGSVMDAHPGYRWRDAGSRRVPEPDREVAVMGADRRFRRAWPGPPHAGLVWRPRAHRPRRCPGSDRSPSTREEIERRERPTVGVADPRCLHRPAESPRGAAPGGHAGAVAAGRGRAAGGLRRWRRDFRHLDLDELRGDHGTYRRVHRSVAGGDLVAHDSGSVTRRLTVQRLARGCRGLHRQQPAARAERRRRQAV